MGQSAPKPRGDDELPPLALAQVWVSRITTVVLLMILPGLGGHWLDERWGTEFLTLVGFGLGLTAGIWRLLQMVDLPEQDEPPESDSQDQNEFGDF
ncbi:MAG: hypothetical protein CMJ48_07625 [Planctomycetaceae bacterium]|nr:hypothetical protein [Planctomycetaceae bacterium]